MKKIGKSSKIEMEMEVKIQTKEIKLGKKCGRGRKQETRREEKLDE